MGTKVYFAMTAKSVIRGVGPATNAPNVRSYS